MKIKKYLKESPIFALNSAYESIIPKLNKQLKAEQLNLLQGLVLTALFFEEKAEVNPSQLAEIFQTSRGNMSHILSALEYQGYIKRHVHRQDARHFNIELKTEGRKKALSLIKFFDRLQDLFEKSIGVSSCQKATETIHLMASVSKDL